MATSLARGRAIIVVALALLTLLFTSVVLLAYATLGDAKVLLSLLGALLVGWRVWGPVWRGGPAARWILVFPFGAVAVFCLSLGSLVVYHWVILDRQIPAWAAWGVGAALLVPGLLATGGALVLAYSPDVGHYLQHRRTVAQEDSLRRQRDREEKAAKS